MIKLREKREVSKLTPDLAKQWLQYNTYEIQRPENPIHTQNLISDMRDGLFRFGEVAFAFLNGDRVMINGQHVCNAVLKSDITVDYVLEEFDVDDGLDLSTLFRKFEILTRSLKQMVKVEAHELGIEYPLWLSALIVSAATIDRLSKGRKRTRFNVPLFTGGGMSKDTRVGFLKEYIEEGNFLFGILGQTRGSLLVKHLTRAAVVYAMIKTYHSNPKDSYLFWCRIRDGENLTKDMPEMKLREYLSETYANSRFPGKGASNHKYIVKCNKAWNACRSWKS